MKKAALPSFLVAVTLLAVAVLAEAQRPGKVPRIAWLTSRPLSGNANRIEAFRQGLRELGYVEGKNIVIEYRSGEGNRDRVPTLAVELVHLKVDVIVTAGASTTRSAKAATNTVPIVMTQDIDPVESGFVTSLARPGGEHHGIIHAWPGAKRKTTGASEGNCSQALPRGRPGNFDRSGPLTDDEGNRERRKVV